MIATDAGASTRRYQRLAHHGRWAVLLLLGRTLSAEPVAAHGKQIDVAVTSLTPDPEQPLLRLYRTRARHAIDGEPVEGAAVVLTALRSHPATRHFPVLASRIHRTLRQWTRLPRQ